MTFNISKSCLFLTENMKNMISLPKNKEKKIIVFSSNIFIFLIYEKKYLFL